MLGAEEARGIEGFLCHASFLKDRFSATTMAQNRPQEVLFYQSHLHLVIFVATIFVRYEDTLHYIILHLLI